MRELWWTCLDSELITEDTTSAIYTFFSSTFAIGLIFSRSSPSPSEILDSTSSLVLALSNTGPSLVSVSFTYPPCNYWVMVLFESFLGTLDLISPLYYKTASSIKLTDSSSKKTSFLTKGSGLLSDWARFSKKLFDGEIGPDWYWTSGPNYRESLLFLKSSISFSSSSGFPKAWLSTLFLLF